MGEGRAIERTKVWSEYLKKLTRKNKTKQGNIKRQTTGKMKKCHHQEIPIRDGKRKMRR